MEYEIRPIEEKDIEGLWHVLDCVAREQEYLAFDRGPSIDKMREFVLHNIQNNHPQFVCVLNETVIGWCDVIPSDRPTQAHTGSMGLGLLPEHRGKGLGTLMIMKALDTAKTKGLKRIKLTTHETNQRAIELYKKIGFQVEGVLVKESFLKGRYLDVLMMGMWVGPDN
ncbi:MAG: GNAT family N-acetyltransferase [Alphaproteobacteria bacterium]|nr:GNAT family N-acetyltransferase [Alphaproteobacteria bacterium]